MASEPSLDADDIQGNIIPGFRRQGQCLVYFTAGSEKILRDALSILAPRLTAVPPVVRHRDARKAALEQGLPEPQLPELWVNIALGAAALDRLGERGVRALDPAFRIGMRPARTGDPWNPVAEDGDPNPSHPQSWRVGTPSTPLDLLVILGFDDWSRTDGDALLDELTKAGAIEISRDDGHRLPGDAEHFGFADGISEIGVRGEFEIDGAVRPVTTRHGVPPRNGVEFGRPGQPLAWPGQFLLGAQIGANSVDPAPARYLNSSFLVFRRLSQDVRAFDEDTEEAANQQGMSAERMRALIVGRWPSGAALMRHAQEPATADGILAENYFGFGEDSPDITLDSRKIMGAKADSAPVRGLTCPAFAHIRKVNPRDLPTDLGGAENTRGFQMLRRGLPFGLPYDREDPDNPRNKDDRGLLFLAYQRAPSLQFEKLNSSWMNTDDGPGPGGFDLLVGQHVSETTGSYLEKPATLYDAAEPAPGRAIAGRRTWVRPSGGAYLFAPSVTLAFKLAAGPQSNDALSEYAGTLTGHKMSPKIFGVEVDTGQFSLGPSLVPRYDGETIIRQGGGQEEIVSADWPETALLPAAADRLHGAQFRQLDLSGFHFPTETLQGDDAANMARSTSFVSLKLDGTALDGAALARLVRTAPKLRNLGCAGLDIDDADVASLIDASDDIEEIALGTAPPRDGHRFTSSRLTPSILSSLERLPKLKALTLRGIPIDDDAVTSTSLWARLVKLDLSQTAVSDGGIRHISAQASLGELDLAWTGVGDAGALELVDHSLIGLDLSHTNVSQNAVVQIDSTRLERIALAGLGLNDALSQWLGGAVRLTHVDLSFSEVSSHVAQALGKLRDLKVVSVASTALKPGDTAILLSGSSIEDVDLSGIGLDAEDRRALASAGHLTRAKFSLGSDWSGLEAVTARVSISGTEPQSGSPPENLQQLRLGGPASVEFVGRLSGLPHLESLSLRYAEPAIRFSSGFGHLREFFGMNIDLNDEAAAELANLPHMAALYVSGNPFGDAIANALSSNIHTLELRDTRVSDKAIDAIAALPRLHCIDLPGTAVTPAGVAKLASDARNLQSLALDGSQVDPASAAALGDAHRLTEIYLYGETVTTATVAALASVRIRELQLLETAVRDDAVPHLAAIEGLRVLTLGNELSDSAIAALQSLRPFLEVRTPGRSLGRMNVN